MNQWDGLHVFLEKTNTKLSNSLLPTLEHHAPCMRVQRTTENTKHSEGNRMQRPDSMSFSSYRPDHISLADPVKEWLDHPPLSSLRFFLRVRGPPKWQPGIGWAPSGLSRRVPRMWLRQTEPRYRWVWAQKYLIEEQAVETIG